MFNILRFFSKNLKIFGLKMEVITLHKYLIKLISVHPQMKQTLVIIANEPFCAILLFLIEHNTYDTTYNELFSMNRDVSVNQKHLRFLVTKVFKSVNNLNPHFFWDYFKTNFFPYDLRKGNTLHFPSVHSTRHGINSLLFRGSLLWNNLSKEIKESVFSEEFKERLKEHGALPCSCVVYR